MLLAQMRSYWHGGLLSPSNRCPYKKREIWPWIQREDGPVKTELEIRVALAQAKEQEPPEAGRDQEGFDVRVFKENSPTSTLISDVKSPE